MQYACETENTHDGLCHYETSLVGTFQRGSTAICGSMVTLFGPIVSGPVVGMPQAVLCHKQRLTAVTPNPIKHFILVISDRTMNCWFVAAHKVYLFVRGGETVLKEIVYLKTRAMTQHRGLVETKPAVTSILALFTNGFSTMASTI